MGDNETEVSEANTPAEHGGNVDQRLTRLENVVNQIKDAVIPGSHAEAERRTEQRLDRGSSVEEQVRAELDRARQEERAQAAKDAERAEGESLKERLARLEEKPPAPPRSRRTVLLGWGDGRQ